MGKDVVFQGFKKLVHFFVHLLVGHQFVVYIDHREDDADAVFFEECVEVGFPKAVAFPREASHTVAVHGMVELALGGDDHHLTR